jgi:glycosyltransferase involved in cell wall biosynthesis
VVATRIGGIPEQIEDGVTGFLVPAQDSGAMAERVMRLQENEPLRKTMGVKASERARKLFSLERMVDEYLSWYQEILRNQDKTDKGKFP